MSIKTERLGNVLHKDSIEYGNKIEEIIKKIHEEDK